MSNASQKTILVVDDEVDLCEILQFDFEDAGYRVFKAHRAAEALHVLQKQSIDLIVSDIRMPGGDGVHLLGEVRNKHFEKPPVIFVSGFADVTMAEAYHKGVVGFIAKPLAFETLLRTVERNLLAPADRWKESAAQPSPARTIERSFASLAHAESKIQLLLGRGGVFIQMDEELPRWEEVVRITIRLEQESVTLEGIAACRWIRNATGSKQPRGAGLEWMSVGPASAEFINWLMREQRRIPFIPNQP